jgi:hypothetical protein
LRSKKEKQDERCYYCRLAEAKANYHKLFQEFFKELEPLEDGQFWSLLKNTFVPEVLRAFVNKTPGYISTTAAHNLFCQPIKSSISFDTGLHFAATWRLKTKELYTPLFDIVENRGDDAYGDLLDSLPLLGHKFYERCLAGDFKNNKDFENEVKLTCKTEGFAKFILHGENYFAMHLWDKAEEFFVYKKSGEVFCL